jgi:hypothetical protein
MRSSVQCATLGVTARAAIPSAGIAAHDRSPVASRLALISTR